MSTPISQWIAAELEREQREARDERERITAELAEVVKVTVSGRAESHPEASAVEDFRAIAEAVVAWLEERDA